MKSKISNFVVERKITMFECEGVSKHDILYLDPLSKWCTGGQLRTSAFFFLAFPEVKKFKHNVT